MKKCGWVVLCVLAASVACANTAFAGGWGPFFSWARTEPKAGFPGVFQDLVLEINKDNGYPVPEDQLKNALDSGDFDLKVDHLTFGVLYDSAPSRDKLFNYRMTLGWDIATDVTVRKGTILGVDFPIDIDLDESSNYGFGWKNTFGFGIIRTDFIKWWAGPALNLNFNYWDSNGTKAATFGIGGGAETGVNIHIAPKYSICLGGGILWNAFGYGIGLNDEMGSFVWGNGPFYFIQVAGLYHTGEDQTAWQQAAVAPPQVAPGQ